MSVFAAFLTNLWKTLELIPHDKITTKLAAHGSNSNVLKVIFL